MLRTTDFMWHGEEQTLSAEVSDLQWPVMPRSFEMYSHHTGNKLTFEWYDTSHDSEGDVKYWHYRPVDDGTPHNVKKVLVFND
jgi:hypothetical protein